MDMNRKPAVLAGLFALLLVAVLAPVINGQKTKRRDRDDRREEAEEKHRVGSKEEERQREVDDPAEEETLNRELWEFAKKTPYSEILPYVAAEQRKSRATRTSEVELPNGWRMASAGTQIEVGRLPYEAVPFAGKLVVLDTGYY